MCLAILEDEALPLDMFSKILLPSLLNISHDPVPNVRLLLSQVMSGQIIPRGVYTKVLHGGLVWSLKVTSYIEKLFVWCLSCFVEVFTLDSHPQHQEIFNTLERLKVDSDKDVRYFANPVPEQTILGEYEDDAIEDIDVETVSLNLDPKHKMQEFYLLLKCQNKSSWYQCHKQSNLYHFCVNIEC